MQKNLGYVIPSIVIPDETNNIGYWYLGNVPLGVRATGTMWTIGNDHYWYLDGSKTDYLAEIPVETYNQQFATMLENYGTSFNTWFNHMKDQLDSDAAGHLQLEIDELNRHLGVFFNSDADAEEALEQGQLEDGTIVYTNDGEEENDNPDAQNIKYNDGTQEGSDVQTQLDMLTTLRLAGSQVGAGSTNVVIDTNVTKRLLCITKKSGVVVESKEIPVAVLSANDVIPLGQNASVITVANKHSIDYSLAWRNPNGDSIGGNGQGLWAMEDETFGRDESLASIGTRNLAPANLEADLSSADSAKITYNGNNSFTITSVSGLSVYLYADMMVRGGATTAKNVAFDSAGTNLQSNDVDGAIKEVLSKMSRPLDFAHKVDLSANSSYTTSADGVLLFANTTNTTGDLTIDGESIFNYTSTSAGAYYQNWQFPLKAGTVIANTFANFTNKSHMCSFVPYAD